MSILVYTEEPLPLWKKVWRQAVVPFVDVESLESLRLALTNNDQRLVQQATTIPPPLLCVRDWPVECCCLLGWLFWKGGSNPEFSTVEEVEEVFAKFCFEIDQVMGEPAACRYLLNHYDETPRQEMIQELLPEVNRAIALKIAELESFETQEARPA